jgi:hypothetical protein
MAKFKFAPTIAGIIGTLGTGVYYRTNSAKFGLLRTWVMPKPSASTVLRGSYISNLSKVWKESAHVDGKADLATYGQKYKLLPVYGEGLSVRTASGFAIWYKALYAYSVAVPATDLSTLSDGDIELVASQINTVAALVNNGYLPAVDGYELLTKPIIVVVKP